MINAEASLELLDTGQPSDQISISYYPTQDGNPQYWGRIYPAGRAAELFGAPTVLPAARSGTAPYVQLDTTWFWKVMYPSLLEYLQDTARALSMPGVKCKKWTAHARCCWQVGNHSMNSADTFDGTVRRTAEGDFLELSDGSKLNLPDLPADVPADLPLYRSRWIG